MRASKPDVTPEFTSPGAFLPDGCWNDRGQMHHRGAVDRLVRELVRQRRLLSLTPAQAAKAIGASSQAIAFPNWRQWESCGHWALAWTNTAAEDAVKRSGRSPAGHWCSGQFQSGTEKDCQETVHRDKMAQDEVRGLVSSVLDKAPAVPVQTTSTPDEAPEPPDFPEGLLDESWEDLE